MKRLAAITACLGVLAGAGPVMASSALTGPRLHRIVTRYAAHFAPTLDASGFRLDDCRVHSPRGGACRITYFDAPSPIGADFTGEVYDKLNVRRVGHRWRVRSFAFHR